jgi:hypothetical protein
MMRLPSGFTGRVVDAYDRRSLSARARARRWQVFLDTFPDIAEMSIVDLGGDARAWRLAPIRPAHVLLVNLFPQDIDEPWMDAMIGDVCDLSLDLPKADLAYSNSVIEHVGGHWRRQRFAEVVQNTDRFWVQTPNRYFPIEPHFMFPWLQHLPLRAQRAVVTNWPLGNYASVSDSRQAVGNLLDVELLSGTELRFYFPDARIWKESFLGLTKSLVAFRAPA